MHKKRRDFLRLAGRTCLISTLAGAGGVRLFISGHDHDTKPGSLSSLGIPIPGEIEPAPDGDLVRRIKAISNVFEVGGPEPNYAYVEDLGDGRAYTVTQYGFCTYNTEVTQVIERYTRLVPDTALARFLSRLPPLATGDVDALSDFPAAWREEIKDDQHLVLACDEQANKLYLRPALKAAATAGINSAIGKSVFYDTWLQHGAGGDPDSLTAILQRTIDETGGVGNSETSFLRTFLAIRKEVLQEPANHATREVWRASSSRVDALLRLLDNNPDLVPPIGVANAEIDVMVL